MGLLGRSWDLVTTSDQAYNPSYKPSQWPVALHGLNHISRL